MTMTNNDKSTGTATPTPNPATGTEQAAPIPEMTFDEICRIVARQHRRRVLRLVQGSGTATVDQVARALGLTLWESLVCMRFLQARGQLEPVPAWRVVVDELDDEDEDEDEFSGRASDDTGDREAPDDSNRDRPGRWSRLDQLYG